MRFAEYVIGGWSLTGAALAAYWVRLVVRTRRAERLGTAPMGSTER
jgi:hypothetical protein